MTLAPIVVVKMGGSLLDWPEWPARLGAFLAGLGPRRVVLVVGGGRIVDAVRELDRVHALGNERAHALALAALGTTARLAATLVPDTRLVGDPSEFADAWAAGLMTIVDPSPLLNAIETVAPTLASTWETTSDSIAARVAHHLGAAELVLLKSVSLPPAMAAVNAPDWTAAAALGLVDPEFPRVAAPIPGVRFVNLRARIEVDPC